MPLNNQWFNDQEDHALACARYGDCIFDVVQGGAADLEAQWSRLSQSWNKLIDKAVQGRFLGLGAPIVDRRWLSFVLFQPSRLWPSGLSKEETQLLKLAKAVVAYYPMYAQGIERGTATDAERVESNEATLAALKKFAALFKRQIGLPMWKAYNSVSDLKAKEIAPLCKATYGEECSYAEARGMFQGDLERGWKLKTLEVAPPTYRVFPYFLSWISG